MLTTHLHLTPRLRMSGAMPLLSLTPSCYRQEQLYLFCPLRVCTYINAYRSFATTVSQLQQCHNSQFVIFQEKSLKVLKCYNFLLVQQRHNRSPAASFATCVMTLNLLKVHLQTFLSITVTQKCQILSCNTPVVNERYIGLHPHIRRLRCTWLRNRHDICSFQISRSSYWPLS
jgi:hypothetical protein